MGPAADLHRAHLERLRSGVRSSSRGRPGRFQLQGEFRSPKRTLLIPAFQEDDRRYVLRFAPTEPGEWDYRLTSSLKRLDGQLGKITASESDSPGFVRVANVHHFAWEGTNKQHLWMATALDDFTKVPRADFDRAVEQRVAEKFTHLRVTIAADTDLRRSFRPSSGDQCDGTRRRHRVGAFLRQAGTGTVHDRHRRAFLGAEHHLDGRPAFEKLPGGKAILKDAGTQIANSILIIIRARRWLRRPPRPFR